jgi:hypothetical protein
MDILITEDLDSPAIQKLAGKYQIVRASVVVLEYRLGL